MKNGKNNKAYYKIKYNQKRGDYKMSLPKYFNNLHLAIGTITGQPRICSLKKDTKLTDVYKDVPEKEWENCLMLWFHYFEEGKTFLQVLNDYTFCIGGKAKDKQQLITLLRTCADKLEKTINE